MSNASPREHEPPRTDGEHGEHAEVPVQERHVDRVAHAERMDAPAPEEQERLARGRRRVAPQTTDPFAPALGDEHAPPAAAPVEPHHVHAGTVRTRADTEAALGRSLPGDQPAAGRRNPPTTSGWCSKRAPVVVIPRIISSVPSVAGP